MRFIFVTTSWSKNKSCTSASRRNCQVSRVFHFCETEVTSKRLGPLLGRSSFLVMQVNKHGFIFIRDKVRQIYQHAILIILFCARTHRNIHEWNKTIAICIQSWLYNIFQLFFFYYRLHNNQSEKKYSLRVSNKFSIVSLFLHRWIIAVDMNE